MGTWAHLVIIGMMDMRQPWYNRNDGMGTTLVTIGMMDIAAKLGSIE